MDRTKLLANASAISIGALGAGLAWLLGFPAPALTGPAIVVSLASLFGLRLAVANTIRNACFIIIGLSLGTSVTPEVIEAAKQWPISFLALTANVTVIVFLGGALLHLFWKIDRSSALLCASPGHLSLVLGISVDRKGDTTFVSVVQSIRILALTLIVPFGMGFAGYDMKASSVTSIKLNFPVVAVSIGCAILLSLVLKRLKVPAALFIAGMLVSTTSHLTGLAVGAMPVWATIPAFVIMGSLLGTRFSGTSLSTLRRAFGAGILTTFVAVSSTAILAVILRQFVDIPLPQLLIAFAPGGVEAMAAMSSILGVDPTFVAVHHVWRLAILPFLLPIALAMAADRSAESRNIT